jgi:hypothetical protein
VRHLAWITLVGWLLAPVASAHPGGHDAAGGGIRGVVGQRSVLDVSGERVAWDYVLEMPERRLVAEAKEDARAGGDPTTYMERTLAALADGLHLTVDGAEVPLVRETVASPARAGEPGFVELYLRTTVVLPPQPDGERTLALRIANHPLDEGGYFATRVNVDGALVVTRSSLARMEGGTVRDERHGAWVREESMREPTLTVRRAGFLEHRDGAHPLPARLEGAPTLAPPPWALAVAGLALVPVAWFGRWAGTRARAAREAAARADIERADAENP